MGHRQDQLTQTIDPDGDLVTYKIYLSDSLLASDYGELNFIYKKLKELTACSIKIGAADSKQKETVKTQNFTTKRYFLKFLKKIE